jgi:hypothetical protein
MEQCQSLEALTLERITLDENHCRVLGALSRPGLEIEMKFCRITSAAATVLAQVLTRNQGPTKLTCCKIDNFVLTNALRGNSSLKCLEPRFPRSEGDNRQALAITSALRENKGLVKLDLSYCSLSDEPWDAVCDSLKTHPTLKVLRLWHIFGEAPAAITSRIQALVDMLRGNTLIHTIDFHFSHHGNELCRGSVAPYPKTNRFWPRLLAIQKIRPIAYRAKVLGRALLVVRTDPNRLSMLLSGNPEVAFPSTTATTTPAANLPYAYCCFRYYW